MKLASDFWTNKTTILAIAAILGSLGTAIGIYAETGDWKAALWAVFAALYAAFQATQRDARAKGDAATVAATNTLTMAVENAASQPPRVVVVAPSEETR